MLLPRLFSVSLNFGRHLIQEAFILMLEPGIVCDGAFLVLNDQRMAIEFVSIFLISRNIAK